MLASQAVSASSYLSVGQPWPGVVLVSLCDSVALLQGAVYTRIRLWGCRIFLLMIDTDRWRFTVGCKALHFPHFHVSACGRDDQIKQRTVIVFIRPCWGYGMKATLSFNACHIRCVKIAADIETTTMTAPTNSRSNTWQQSAFRRTLVVHRSVRRLTSCPYELQQAAHCRHRRTSATVRWSRTGVPLVLASQLKLFACQAA